MSLTQISPLTYTVAEGENLTINEADILSAFELDAGSSNLRLGNLSLSSYNGTSSPGFFNEISEGVWQCAPDQFEPDFNGTFEVQFDLRYDTLNDDGSTIQIFEEAFSDFVVTPVADAPILENSIPVRPFSNEDESVIISKFDFVRGYNDPDNLQDPLSGDTLSVTNLTVSSGSIVENSDGDFVYTPEANFNGQVQLNYSLTNEAGLSVAGQQGSFIEVGPEEDPTIVPTITDPVVFGADGKATVNVADIMSNISDADWVNPQIYFQSINSDNIAFNSTELRPDGTVELTYILQPDSDGNEIDESKSLIHRNNGLTNRKIELSVLDLSPKGKCLCLNLPVL